jgi:predicted Zn-dependent protease
VSEIWESTVLLFSTLAALFIGTDTMPVSSEQLKSQQDKQTIPTHYSKRTDFSPENIEIIALNNAVTKDVTNAVAKKLSDQYSIPVHVLRYKANLTSAYVAERQQYDGKKLLGILELPRQKNTYVIYIIDGDIYTTGYNFLFAHTDFKSHETVISMSRFKDEHKDSNISIERLNKLLMRRIGFAYGLESNECVMYFAPSLEEFDKVEATYCPQDKAFLERRGVLKTAFRQN